MSINRAIFSGHLTRDSEIKDVGNTCVLEFSVAVNEYIKGRDGDEGKEIAHFLDCQLWGKRGEALEQYLLKGVKVAVEARIKYESWEDRDTGKNRSKIVFNVQEIELASKGGGGDDEGGGRRGGRDRDDRGSRGRDDRGGRSGGGRGRDDRGRGRDDRGRGRDDRGSRGRERAAETEDDFEDDIPF